MKLEVKRTTKTGKATVGEMYLNGKFQCYTLEDVVREDGVKVFGETAIPAGTYKVVLNMSNRFKKILPQVLNVPMFEGIRIHPGNYAKDTEGCILVGKTKAEDFIGSSQAAFAELYPKLEAAFESGEEITLIIS